MKRRIDEICMDSKISHKEMAGILSAVIFMNDLLEEVNKHDDTSPFKNVVEKFKTEFGTFSTEGIEHLCSVYSAAR